MDQRLRKQRASEKCCLRGNRSRCRQQPNSTNIPALMPTKGQNILILGHPYKRTSSVIRQMLHDGYHITHYVERKAIYTIPGLLQSLILNIDNPSFQALMVDKRLPGAWHLMVTDAGEMFLNGEWYSVSGGQNLFSSLRPENGIPLYWLLNTGEETGGAGGKEDDE